jgi:hypothetical protein
MLICEVMLSSLPDIFDPIASTAMKKLSSLTANGCDSALSCNHGVLNIVAICNGFIGAVYAHEAIESLSMMLDPSVDVQSSYWSFDMLHHSDVNRCSVEAAIRADLLIVSAHAASSLPAHVRSWIMTVMQESQQDAPAIAAFHADTEDTTKTLCPMCEFLTGVAALWHTNFLCNESFDHQLERGLAPDLLQRRQQKQKRMPSKTVRPLSARNKGFAWGIPV